MRPRIARRVRGRGTADRYRQTVADPAPPVERRTIVVDLDWRSVVVAVALSLVLVLAAGLVRSAARTVTWVVIGGLLALALNPLVSAVQRRLHCRRGVGVAIVLVAFVAVVTLVVLAFGPPAARQA